MKYFILLFPFFLFGIELNEILTHEKGDRRDFYLSNFMKETNSSFLAYEAYTHLYRVRSWQLKRLSKKNPFFKDVYNCKNLNETNFDKYPKFCIEEGGLSFYKITTFNQNNLEKLSKIISHNKKLKYYVKLLKQKNYKKIKSNKELFFQFYTKSSYKLKRLLNSNIDKYFLESIKNDKRFSRFLSLYVRSDYNKIKKSLLNISYTGIKNADTSFLLAMNALQYNKPKKALNYLLYINKRDNKINFWIYQLTKKRFYLNELLKKNRVGFYTLYAYDKVGKNFPIQNNIIFNTAPTIKYDITNTFDIHRFYNDFSKESNLFKFAKTLDNIKELPLKAIVLDKAFRYNKNFFIIPKYNYTGLSVEDKSFLLALARQESRFVPASLSHSFAVGIMQMMPFLIRSLKKDESIYAFFKADINIKYAKKHISWLKNSLQNPLFVSYAYNGGIGFVKRKVIPKFKFKGKFEPYLSMELVSYGESREYGKKVLANYVIYNRIFGNNIKLSDVLK